MVQGLTRLSFTARDLENLAAIDERLASLDAGDPWVRDLFVGAYRDVFDGIRAAAPAVAVPYNEGTVIAAPNGRLVGIDLALLEDYYDGKDWEIPGWLYDVVSDRLDLLIVSHGHWDHCWVELVRAMRWKRKPVIVPEGIRPCRPKALPWGCWGVRDGAAFWWNGIHLSFRFAPHVYKDGYPCLVTRVWDGRTAFLHTGDADTTAPAFAWPDRFPVDALLFKMGGVSPHHDDYEEMARTVDRIAPRRLLLPMHLNELGHRGTEAAMGYLRAYEHLARFKAEGRLGDRLYAVLFGNRVVGT